MTDRTREPLGRLRRAHRATAALVLNTALAFLLVNLIAWPIATALRSDPITALYGRDTVLAAYPDREPSEVDDLLEETWSGTLAYRPFLQARERPRRGRFVNVSEPGFRHSKDQAPWPPPDGSFAVFVLGGSTAFGHGVADDETFASYLQEELRRAPLAAAGDRDIVVYNFAAPGYYSSHERILLGELVAAGHPPDLAVFLDGLNDFYFDEPQFTERLERLMSERPLVYVARLARGLPVLELAMRWVDRRRGQAALAGPTFDPGYDDPALLDARIERYLANARQSAAAAQEYGVATLFVVQPVPSYEYDLAQHPFARWSFDAHAASHFGYPRLKERLDREPAGARVLWAGDLLRDRHEPLFVDQVHYGPVLARDLARFVAAELTRSESTRP